MDLVVGSRGRYIDMLAILSLSKFQLKSEGKKKRRVKGNTNKGSGKAGEEGISPGFEVGGRASLQFQSTLTSQASDKCKGS